MKTNSYKPSYIGILLCIIFLVFAKYADRVIPDELIIEPTIIHGCPFCNARLLNVSASPDKLHKVNAAIQWACGTKLIVKSSIVIDEHISKECYQNGFLIERILYEQ